MTATSPSATARFVRIVARARAEHAELVAAAAWEAGICGLEEREETGDAILILYAPRSRARAVLEAVHGEGARASAPEAVPEEDWSETWKLGLSPQAISPRLGVRPSFAAWPDGRPAAELVIDPGQAFGTGGHPSTRLALEAIDALLARERVRRVLDLGTGSGILALAALRLGAEEAFACDTDARAVREAWANARANGLGERLHLFAGPLEALRPLGVDLAVANLLSSELRPLLAALAAQIAPGGRLVISGWLASERDACLDAIAAAGFAPAAEYAAEDAGGEGWIAFMAGRRAPSASARAGGRGCR